MTTLVEELGYVPGEPNIVQRGVQRLGATPPGAWLLSKTLAPMDKWLLRVTAGRNTFASIVGGMPVITVATTGAKSGKRRATPLTGIPIEGSLAVVGTNYGQSKAPAWTFNLAANPSATVEYRGRSAPVVARIATDEEYEYAFERGARMYPGYAEYRERISDRPIHVFVLDHDDRL